VSLRFETLESRWAWLAANLAIWLVLVGLFTQSIEVWRLIAAWFGSGQAGIAPFLISILLLAAVAAVMRKRREALAWPWIVLAAVVFAAGLALTDPAFPAKRIHVPQYFLLTVFVYRSLRSFMLEGRAIWGGVLLAAMLGGVDEIAQGALPTRSFGLWDLVTNGLGALAAGFCLRAFSPGSRIVERSGMLLSVAGLAVGLGLLLVAAEAHRGIGFPLWIYLPAVASLGLPAAFGDSTGTRLLPAVTAVCMIAVVSLFAIDALDLDFR